jgi:hypothetical protein
MPPQHNAQKLSVKHWDAGPNDMKFDIPKTWISSKAHLEEGKSIEAGRLNTEAMNINDRPAPETDRVERIIPSRLSPVEFDQQQGEWVPADHARRLERQRDAAVVALEDIMHSLDVGSDPRDCRDEEATSPKSRARTTLAAIKRDKL